MKVQDIINETEVLEEDIMLSRITLSQLDNLVKFTIIPLYIEELNLTKREIKQASIYVQNKTIELISQKSNQI